MAKPDQEVRVLWENMRLVQWGLEAGYPGKAVNTREQGQVERYESQLANQKKRACWRLGQGKQQNPEKRERVLLTRKPGQGPEGHEVHWETCWGMESLENPRCSPHCSAQV